MSKLAAPQLEKIMKETTDFNAQYSDACTKSGAILMKGVEDIMGTVISLAQNSAEKQAAFVKEAMNIKTIDDLAEVQNKIVKANFDDFMSGATKISEISVKVLTDSAEPVNSHITKAVKSAQKSMAA